MIEYTLTFLFLFLIAAVFYLGYERFSQRGDNKPDTLYVSALRDLLDGRQEMAFSKLRQVVAEDSGNLDAYLRLGQILRENSQVERAVQVHKDLTLRRPLSKSDKVAILRQLTTDYLALDDTKLAEAALSELINIANDDHWAHVRLLEQQEGSGQWAAAYDTATQLLRLEGNKSRKPLAKYKYEDGELLRRKREYHKARILYKEAIGLDPTYVRAYLAIGDSYCEEERFEDALTFWNKLISSVPDQGHLVIDRLKDTLFDLGRFGEIEGICETILDHSPKNIDARRALAEFREKKGDIDQAVELWEQMVDDFPNDSSLVLELVRVYLEKNSSRKITELLKSLEHKRDRQSVRSSDTTTSSPTAGAQA